MSSRFSSVLCSRRRISGLSSPSEGCLSARVSSSSCYVEVRPGTEATAGRRCVRQAARSGARIARRDLPSMVSRWQSMHEFRMRSQTTQQLNPTTYVVRCVYPPTVPVPSRQRPLEMIAVEVLSPNDTYMARPSPHVRTQTSQHGHFFGPPSGRATCYPHAIEQCISKKSR